MINMFVAFYPISWPHSSWFFLLYSCICFVCVLVSCSVLGSLGLPMKDLGFLFKHLLSFA